MKIKNIKVETEGNSIKVSAMCTIRHFGDDEIYFKFDKRYKDFLMTDASPFAAALLIPSMKLGEDLIIEGSISEKLFKNMREIQKTILSWNIGCKPINIIPEKLIKDTQKPTEVATFFSGGVDSFYTYLKHVVDKDKIKYFISVNGFDIELHNPKLWEATLSNVKKIAQKENIKVIEVETN